MSIVSLSKRLTANGVSHLVVAAGKCIDVDPKIIWDLLAEYRKVSGIDLTTKITNPGNIRLVVRTTQDHISPEFKSPARLEAWLRSAINKSKAKSEKTLVPESRYGNNKQTAANFKP